ncbi:MAG: HAMP domain-containing sensor histidine kinase [Deltaproteobacteria bacterium]|nr:HAMP domain-containing sensor histidine kinase [Deltaproteobacteria bacterium]
MPTKPMPSLRCYLGARLHRRLFAWFGVAIVMTTLTVAMSMHMVASPETSIRSERARVERFVSAGFARVWDDSAGRDELARSYGQDLGFGVRVRDLRGQVITEHGFARGLGGLVPHWTTAVRDREGHALGTVEISLTRTRMQGAPWRTLITLLAGGLMLWAISNKVAHRLSRPIEELTRVAQALGEGDLSRRANLCHTHPGEVGELTRAINEMATRIERQVKEQRQLLAAVSHEMRTPLARVRILLEMARDGSAPGSGKDPLDEIEAEVLEMDSLVGELLASARLEFSALSRRALDPREVAERAADRASLPSEAVKMDSTLNVVHADPTLLSRALGALLDNARKYGRGTVILRVSEGAARDTIAFAVEDEGDGFDHDDRERVFEAFYRGQRARESEARGVGLGLSLVRRIAEAHGGSVRAENTPNGGARVVIELPTRADLSRGTKSAPEATQSAAA